LGIGDLGGTGTLVVGTTGSGLPVVRAKDKLIVGNLGSGSLEINEGGLVGAGELQVGAADPNDSGSVSVNGPGNGAGFAFLGVKGPAVLSRQNAQLTISGGGSLLCQQGLQIAPSGQAQVVVTGSGSSVAVDGILLVAAASASGRATLNIAGGGTVIPEDATKRLSVIVGDSFSGPGAVTLSNVTGASKPSTMDVTSIDLTDGSMDINDHCLVQAGIVNVGQVGVATLTLAGSGVTDSLLKCQTLNVGGQGILRLCPAAKMEASVTADFAAGSQWAGGGIIDTPALHDNGLIRVGCSPGTLTVNGDFEMGETGVLEIEVGGLEPGQFDVLQVNGNATLAGRLELKFINGFVPKPGDNIDFLQVSGQITGQLSGDTIIDVPADAASGQAAAQATVTWDVTPEGTLRMTVTDVQGIDEVAQDIPAAGCGAGACGASAVSMLPFTLVGMNFMKLRRRRRYRLDR
jgi:T5SS/PEP-CTERM-associated repeat protein